MATNRTRRTRGRPQLDNLKISELHYGPGTCLLAGAGYYIPNSRKFYFQHTEEEQAHIIAWMRDDWMLGHRIVMEAWDNRDEHDLYIAREHHGDPAEPWALTEFGEPQ